MRNPAQNPCWLALLLFGAIPVSAGGAAHSIVRSYGRIVDAHLSHLAPEMKRELARRWLAPGADPLKPPAEVSTDIPFSDALSLVSQAAAELDTGERELLPALLRARLAESLGSADTEASKVAAVDTEERSVTERKVYNVYRDEQQVRVKSLALSPDGKRIAIAETFTNTVTIQDFDSQKHVKTLEFDYSPESLRFSLDGRYLAVSFFDSSFKGFEIFETTRWKSVLKDRGGGSQTPVFLGSDRVVEWGRERNRIFSLKSKNEDQSPLELSGKHYTDQVVAPDGSWFAGLDERSKKYEIFSGEGKRIGGFKPKYDASASVVYLSTSDGKTLIRVYDDWVDFHEIPSGKFLSRRSLRLQGGGEAEGRGMAVDRTRQLLFVSDRGGGVNIYRIEPDKAGPKIRRIKTLTLPKERMLKPGDLYLTPDEKRLLVDAGPKVVLFDLELARTLGEL